VALPFSYYYCEEKSAEYDIDNPKKGTTFLEKFFNSFKKTVFIYY
jgi:hypothetical protein